MLPDNDNLFQLRHNHIDTTHKFPRIKWPKIHSICLRFVFTERKRRRKNFFFDLRRCPMWTLNWDSFGTHLEAMPLSLTHQYKRTCSWDYSLSIRRFCFYFSSLFVLSVNFPPVVLRALILHSFLLYLSPPLHHCLFPFFLPFLQPVIVKK